MGGVGGADARTGKYRKTQKTQLLGDRQRDLLRALEQDQMAVNASRLATLANRLWLFQKVALSGLLATLEHGVAPALKKAAGT
jgi:hypothetical protein